MLQKRKRLSYVVFQIAIILVSLEILLRLFKINITYMESVGKPYQSGYNQVFPNYYFIHHQNDSMVLDHKDFRYVHRYNETGLRDMPIDSFLSKCGDAYKILMLGDSYTEGVGAPQDSSWPRLLETKLTEYYKCNVCCLNAGISGSDPFFQYMLFRDKLSHLGFNLVIMAVNTTDISDFIFRGGMERFQEDGTVRSRKGPWYEWLYEYLYIYRLIDRVILGNMKQMFINKNQYQAFAQDFVAEMQQLLRQMSVAVSGNSHLLIIAFPSPHEAVNGNTDCVVHKEKILVELLKVAAKQSIDTCNLFPYFRSFINNENLIEYTYANDGHYNAKGYNLFAAAVAARIDSIIACNNKSL
jgi:hypothetical protein